MTCCNGSKVHVKKVPSSHWEVSTPHLYITGRCTFHTTEGGHAQCKAQSVTEQASRIIKLKYELCLNVQEYGSNLEEIKRKGARIINTYGIWEREMCENGKVP
jgi:hypothetical protein